MGLLAGVALCMLMAVAGGCFYVFKRLDATHRTSATGRHSHDELYRNVNAGRQRRRWRGQPDMKAPPAVQKRGSGLGA